MFKIVPGRNVNALIVYDDTKWEKTTQFSHD